MGLLKQESRIFRISTAVLLLFAGTASAQQVIVDNLDPEFSVLSGTWNSGAFSIPWGSDYRWLDSTGSPGGSGEVEWRPTITTPGNYDVEIWYVSGGNRAQDAPFTVHHVGGTTTIPVNQEVGGGQWLNLGTFEFAAGTSGRVTLTNEAEPSVVIGDAVRFTFESVGGGEDPPEFRGMWVSRFEWPNSSLAVVQSNINAIMTNLGNNNFNAVIFQVRGQMDTLYPSPNEVWSSLVSSDGNTPSGWGAFDPMASAINAAHNNGLEFHAYINTHTAWQAGSCTNPPQKPTFSFDHTFWDHFDADNANARDWLVHDDLGNPIQCEESNYTWVAPGVPDAQAYIREQIMYVVENYDVDGVHWDRIRTPGTEYSHDPISEARRLGEGNPDSLGFADWTRDQITRFNRDIYAQIMEVDPSVKVSSAPLGLYQSSSYPGYPAGPCGFFYGFSCVYQDAQAWLAAGAQDFIVPQIYWADGGGNPDFSEILPDWIANNAGRHIYAGQLRSVGISALLSQVSVTRTMGAEGNTVFSYGSFNSSGYWDDYSDPGGPYDDPAPTPDMPWKSNPTLGIIIGNVTDFVSGLPIVDAHVTHNGSGYTALTSGDGLYSFLLVPPGSYTVEYDKTAVGSRQVTGINVVAGQVTRIDTTLGGPFIAGDYDGDDLVETADDLPLFENCLLGPDVTYASGDPCLLGDADGDFDVDLDDFSQIVPNMN